jgi:hypothetical protein
MPRLPHAREGLTLKISQIRGGVKFDLGPPFHIFSDEIFQGATLPSTLPLWAVLRETDVLHSLLQLIDTNNYCQIQKF